MNQLTLPSSGHVSNIIHVSDIHIRTGDHEHSRYNEYETVFNQLSLILSRLPSVQSGSAVCVFTGDAFHYKNKLDSLSVRLFNMFIKSITQHQIPLYIIQGNHDFVQADPNTPDVVSSLLYGVDTSLVNYLEQTGLYVANNLGIGFTSIKEVLKLGNGSGYVDQLPEFPDANLFPPSVTTRCALFHGSFTNSSFYNDMKVTNGIPIDWIKGKHYNIGLFGDIHKAQILPTNDTQWDEGFKYGYSGSLLQLDHGESMYDHGFLLWDIDQKTVCHHEIPSPYKFISLMLDHDTLFYYIRHKVPFQFSTLELKNFKHLYIRIKGDLPSEHYTQLEQNLKQHNVTYDISKSLLAIQFDGKDTTTQTTTSHVDIVQYNSQKMWIDHIINSDKDQQLKSIQWQEWITHPESLLLSGLNLEIDALNDTIKTRDASIQKCITTFNTNMTHFKGSSKQSLRIHKIKWSYILCFGKDNYFNFNTFANKICAITAPNSGGKSSFLETICYGFYGEESPSRYDRANSSTIICNKKPKGEPSEIIVHFSLGDMTYCIHRVLEFQSSTKNSVHCKNISLAQITPDGVVLNTISTTVTSVNQWVNTHIGSFDNFLMSCVISQACDNDFFNLRDVEQLELLDNVLHLNCIEDMNNIIKETILAVSTINKQCVALKAQIKTLLQETTQVDLPTLEQIQTDINNYQQQIEVIKSEISGMPETWHHLKPDDLLLEDSQISSKITQLLSKRPTDKCVHDINTLVRDRDLLVDKIQSLNHNEEIPYFDGIETQITKLTQDLPEPPHHDLTYYQQKLRESSNSLTKLPKPTNVTTEQLQQIDQQMTLLYESKPNRPEISRQECNEFYQKVKSITGNITSLKKPYNTPEALIAYCSAHQPSSETKMTNISQIKQILQKELHDLLDPSWFTCPIETLMSSLETNQSALGVAKQSLSSLETQISGAEIQLSTLKGDIAHTKTQIIQIGVLKRPKLSREEVDSWLNEYNQNLSVHTSKETDLSHIRSQLEEYNDTNTQHTTYTKRLPCVQQEIRDIEQRNYAFNPKCDACKQQPWIVQKTQLLREQTNILSWLSSHTLHDTSKLEQQIDILTAWINQFKQHRLLLKQYQDLSNEWSIYSPKELQLNQLTSELSSLQESVQELHSQANVLYSRRKSLNDELMNINKQINGLNYAIQGRPRWTEQKRQIELYNKWTQDAHLHDLYQQYIGLDFTFHDKQKELLDLTVSWTKQMEECKATRDRLNRSLEQRDQYLKLKQDMDDLKTQIHSWNEYNRQVNHIDNLKYCLLSHQVRTIETLIQAQTDAHDIETQLSYWQDVASCKPLMQTKIQLTQQLDALTQSLNNTYRDYDKKKSSYELSQKHINTIVHYDTVIDQLTKRHKSLELVQQSLSGYRIWLYSTIVIPTITKTINEIVSVVTGSSEHTLKGISVTKNNKININWFVDSPSGETILAKAGGFRKYIYGLVMRVSLSRMGCSHINNTQLFIDEGFTASDGDNLNRMQTFLHNLQEMYTGGVFIVSHLQTIKDSAHSSVQILKNSDKTAHLVTPQEPFARHKVVAKQSKYKLSLKK
jgi:DNA repair exonuclease SbcCD ATPase subunit/DNA repair exonuclease SbcCD nuclease subunit